jgi:hypothetical protein
MEAGGMHERKHSRLVFAWLSPAPPPVSYCRACVHAELLDQLLYCPVPWRCDQWRRLVAASSRYSTGEDVDVGRACQQCPAMKQKKKDDALPRASSHPFLLRFSGLCPVVATYFASCRPFVLNAPTIRCTRLLDLQVHGS